MAALNPDCAIESNCNWFRKCRKPDRGRVASARACPRACSGARRRRVGARAEWPPARSVSPGMPILDTYRAQRGRGRAPRETRSLDARRFFYYLSTQAVPAPRSLFFPVVVAVVVAALEPANYPPASHSLILMAAVQSQRMPLGTAAAARLRVLDSSRNSQKGESLQGEETIQLHANVNRPRCCRTVVVPQALARGLGERGAIVGAGMQPGRGCGWFGFVHLLALEASPARTASAGRVDFQKGDDLCETSPCNQQHDPFHSFIFFFPADPCRPLSPTSDRQTFCCGQLPTHPPAGRPTWRPRAILHRRRAARNLFRKQQRRQQQHSIPGRLFPPHAALLGLCDSCRWASGGDDEPDAALGRAARHSRR